MKRILVLLFALLLALTPAAGAEASLAANVREGVLRFKAAQSGAEDVPDWVSAHLPRTMGQGGEWYAIALSQCGGCDLSACRAALLSYLDSTQVRSATTRQKLALTLLSTGGEAAFVTATLEDSIGKQGLMSWAWGLHLLNNRCTSPAYTADEVVSTLLSLRKADGGWAVTGSASDVDATAMVLQALAPHRDKAEVAAAISEAVALLSARQLADGGYASFGVENAESTAQVIIALCALGIDPMADARFIKEGATLLDVLCQYRLADGSFAHQRGGAYSESATVQAFLAAQAMACLEAGQGGLYLLSMPAPAANVKPHFGYKPIAVGIICGVAVLACALLLLLGKRHPKNFLAVGVLAALLSAIVLLTDFQSAGSYYAPPAPKADAIGQVTLTIRCDKVAGRAAHIPADGVILAKSQWPIAAGDTVYTVLTDAARARAIHMETSGASGLIYINGIGNLYEFDFGDLSGWVYLVNGVSASVGCDQYVLSPGDDVAFHYTLELGRDIP
ncbi:MAG: DUF4430 domain-containing protein [Clostridiales bacterium]|nr:DUF4430 domain-containing protein [Clostridiales bacterium]